MQQIDEIFPHRLRIGQNTEGQPFSIGKFTPSDVYHFDDTDAKLLFDSIRRDLDNNSGKKSITNKIRKILKY